MIYLHKSTVKRVEGSDLEKKEIKCRICERKKMFKVHASILASIVDVKVTDLMLAVRSFLI